MFSLVLCPRSNNYNLIWGQSYFYILVNINITTYIFICIIFMIFSWHKWFQNCIKCSVLCLLISILCVRLKLIHVVLVPLFWQLCNIPLFGYANMYTPISCLMDVHLQCFSENTYVCLFEDILSLFFITFSYDIPISVNFKSYGIHIFKNST